MKEIFYKKIDNIIENNIKGECRVIMAGDANSVWNDENTTNKNKKDLDKTVKEFCKRRGWTDLSRKWIKKREEKRRRSDKKRG
jgi:exonuclease III